MYTSANDGYEPDLWRLTRNYLMVTRFCLAFGAIYEHFSFGVYSMYMIYAFTVPLIGGVLPAVYCGLHPQTIIIRKRSRKMWRAGIATLTVGSIYTGALEIYGTNSIFSYIYLILGLLWIGMAVIAFLKDNG